MKITKVEKNEHLPKLHSDNQIRGFCFRKLTILGNYLSSSLALERDRQGGHVSRTQYSAGVRDTGQNRGRGGSNGCGHLPHATGVLQKEFSRAEIQKTRPRRSLSFWNVMQLRVLCSTIDSVMLRIRDSRASLCYPG